MAISKIYDWAKIGLNSLHEFHNIFIFHCYTLTFAQFAQNLLDMYNKAGMIIWPICTHKTGMSHQKYVKFNLEKKHLP